MIRRALGRGFGVALAAAVGLAALAALAPGSPAMSSCAGAGVAVGSGPNHAALVIEHGDGSVVTRCVSFSGSGVTGRQLLDASGLAWSGQAFGGFGVAVCAVESEPAHYSSCPGKDNYWAIFVARGGSWQLASTGISNLTLADGDAEGLRYVPAVGTVAAPPAPAGVCATVLVTPATPSPTRAVVSTAAPAATQTSVVAAVTQMAAAPTLPTVSPTAGEAAASPTPAAIAAAGQVASSPPAQAAMPGATNPAPAPGGGVDIGLLLAAVVGGGLAGLALLRLMAARTRSTMPPR